MRKLAAILLAGLALTAQAADWQILYTVKLPAQKPFIKDRLFIDVSSLQWRGPAAKYWVKFVYQDSVVSNGRAVKQDMELHVLDCASRTMTMLRRISYDIHGKQIAEFGPDNMQVQADDIRPDTLGEKEYRFVCSRAPSQHRDNFKYL